MTSTIPFEIDLTVFIDTIALSIITGVILGVFLSLMNMAGNRE
jgi:uncharacterized protein YneF (UPF0154 family)